MSPEPGPGGKAGGKCAAALRRSDPRQEPLLLRLGRHEEFRKLSPCLAVPPASKAGRIDHFRVKRELRAFDRPAHAGRFGASEAELGGDPGPAESAGTGGRSLQV